jgi:peroxiredoxin
MKIIVALLICGFYTITMAQDVKDVQGLQIGDRVEDFSAISSENKLISLDDMLEDGPVVLVFYRGEWCPICNRHLQKLQDSLHFILDKGANVYAVSPDSVSALIQTKKKAI